jgi:hypothetical protein
LARLSAQASVRNYFSAAPDPDEIHEALFPRQLAGPTDRSIAMQQQQMISEQEQQAKSKPYEKPEMSVLGSVEQVTEVIGINPGGSVLPNC